MSARQKDKNGFWLIENNPISKEGVYQYLGAEFGAPDPGKIYNVYRPAEELSKQETLDSFRLIPMINEHTLLGEQGVPADKVGVQGTTGEIVKFEAPYLKSSIRIFGDMLKGLIERGKVELSPAYTCDWCYEEGEYNGQRYEVVQRNIRGNHLALVNQGRTGSDVAVMDQRFAFDADSVVFFKEQESMEFTEEQLGQIKAVVLQVLSEANAEKAIAIEEETTDEANTPAMEEARKDEEEPQPTITDEDLQEIKEQAAQDAVARVMKQIKERDQLAKKLVPHIGQFDVSAFDSAETLADYGLRKLGLKVDSDKIATLNGYLLANKAPIDTIAQDSAVVKKPTAQTVFKKFWGGK